MKRSPRLFLVISLIIFLTDATFVGLNYYFSRTAFNATLEEQSEGLYEEFSLLVTLSYRNMLQLATYIGVQEEVRQLFLEGKRGIEAEGGGAGGPRAAKARQALLDFVYPSWQVLMEEYNLRQLHFQFGPGSVSFLRVHAPGKFGDRMDDIRHIIVDTNAEQTPRTGFETGRVYCGVRGVVPVNAVDPATGELVHVGAMEVGTSFGPLLNTFEHYFTSGLAVYLTRDHVKKTMWPDYIKERFGDDPGELLLEASNRPEIARLLPLASQPDLTAKTPPQLVTLDKATYALSFFPFRDYRGERHPEFPAVGVVALWQEITPQWQEFARSQQVNVIYALIGFLLVELLLFYGYRFGTKKLNEVIEEQVEEIREERRRAVEANALKDTFVSLVAHDLRSPVGGIKGLADLLVERSGDREFEQKALREISQTARQMGTMIGELLDLNRLQTGQIAPELSDVDLMELARSAAAPLLPVASAKGVTIDVALAEGTILRCDPDLMREAIRNLIGNGIKFCHRKGAVRMTTAPNGFLVEDNGVGVAPERIATLTRLEVKTSTPGVEGERGTGLGLPFVDLIVKAHGGRMEIESTVGEGTRITVTLP